MRIRRRKQQPSKVDSCRRSATLLLLAAVALFLIHSVLDGSDYQQSSLSFFDHNLRSGVASRKAFIEDSSVSYISAAQTALANPTTTTTTKIYPSVHCPSQIQTRNHTGYGDPNGLMPESPKRLTITNPAFWISLHKEYFDQLRWASIMVKGNYYETGITDQFRQILENKESGLVIDIGMNIGWFSLWARAHGHAVAAFEPNPIMHTRVCESLTLNRWDDSIGDSAAFRIFPYGLASEPATLNLTMGKNPGSSSFYEDRLAKRFRRQIEVKVVTLDEMAQQEGWLVEEGNNLRTNPPTIHLLKVDVEGFEPQVFGGAQQLLKSGRIENIIMEHSITDLRASTDLLATISQAGYKLHYLSTVNGDAYHPEMLPAIRQALDTSSVAVSLEGIAEEFEFLAKVTCNLWWTKR